MLHIRKSNERGQANHGWLRSRHSFSFASYYDPQFMGFRSLRVINEDRIDGGSGFDRHQHRDMEIISYVVKGALQHEDSMGIKAIIRPGEVQRMTAGTGVFHSEFNALPTEETHFFQIWISPSSTGSQPGYGQISFEHQFNSEKIVQVLSQDGRNGSISVNQDADMFISRLKKDEELDFKVRPTRGVWIQTVSGDVSINGYGLSTGDGIAFENQELLRIKAHEPCELLIFDLA